MIGCRVIVRTPDDSELYGLISPNCGFRTTDYERLLPEKDFCKQFGCDGFVNTQVFEVPSVQLNDHVDVLKFIANAMDFCTNISKTLWDAYDDVPMDKFRRNTVFATELRALIHTTCVTMQGIMQAKGLDTVAVQSNVFGLMTCAVRLPHLIPGDDFSLAVCPISYVATAMYSWPLFAKQYRYDSVARRMRPRDSNDIEDIIAAFELPKDAACAVYKEPKEMSADTTISGEGMPEWRLLSDNDGHPSEWEISVVNSAVFGDYSAVASWDVDTGKGQVSLYRVPLHLCTLLLVDDVYTDADTFKRAAWDAITGHMSSHLLALTTRLDIVMQGYSKR